MPKHIHTHTDKESHINGAPILLHISLHFAVFHQLFLLAPCHNLTSNLFIFLPPLMVLFIFKMTLALALFITVFDVDSHLPSKLLAFNFSS